MQQIDPLIDSDPPVNQEMPDDDLPLDEEEDQSAEQDEEEENLSSDQDGAELLQLYHERGDINHTVKHYLDEHPNGVVLLARRLIPQRYMMHLNAIRRKVGDKSKECAVAALREHLTVGQLVSNNGSQWNKLTDYLPVLSESDVALLTEGHQILKSQYSNLWLSQLPTRNQGFARIAFLRDMVMTPAELWDWFGGEVKLPGRPTRKRKEIVGDGAVNPPSPQ